MRLFVILKNTSCSQFQVDLIQMKCYDVNLIYTGSYDSISSYEIKRDPKRKPVFEFAKLMSQGLSEDLGQDRVYYPERDMLGGVNFFDEFDRVIDNSFVTLLIVSKDISENRWFAWLNHSAVKRQKDKVGLNTIFLVPPEVTQEDLRRCKCDYMMTDNIMYAKKWPSNVGELKGTACKLSPTLNKCNWECANRTLCFL